jgi:hypothetical protein
MADYMCKHCKYNNNGWCVAKKKNKLPGVLECDTFAAGKYGVFVPQKTSTALSACDYCQNNKTILEREEKPYVQVSIENGCMVMVDMFGIRATKINYCPICGKKLGK